MNEHLRRIFLWLLKYLKIKLAAVIRKSVSSAANFSHAPVVAKERSGGRAERVTFLPGPRTHFEPRTEYTDTGGKCG